MTTREAKQILLLHRPWHRETPDAQTAEALALATQDAELREWLAQHLAFQEAMRARLDAIPTPAHLKDALLAQRKIVHPPLWRQPTVWLAAAAAVVLIFSLGALLFQPRTPDRFADFRSRMIRSALRQYSMDIVTNDMQQVRQFMAARGAPADYALPAGLQRLSLTGGGYLKWRSQPVAMVCFDRGDSEMLYLFVMDRAAVKDAPPPTPELARVNKLVTVSWSAGDRAYVLAGPEEADFARKYL
jgi:hypothetical protein